VTYRGGSRNPHTIYDVETNRPIGVVFDPADRGRLIERANLGARRQVLDREGERRRRAFHESMLRCTCGHWKMSHLMVAGQGHVGPCCSTNPDDTCVAFELDASAS